MDDEHPTTARRDRDAPPRGLYAREPERDLGQLRTLKVSIPLRQHIQLRALRLLHGGSLSGTVEAALDLYLEKLRTERSAGPASMPLAEAA